jgi:hypothetical protein
MEVIVRKLLRLPPPLGSKTTTRGAIPRRALVVLVAITGCANGNPPPDRASENSGTHAMEPAGSAGPGPHGSDIRAAHGPEVADAVEQIRRATAHFQDLELAVAAGYSRDGGACLEHPPEGAMGYHHMNRAWMDDVLELERPEILNFERSADGGYELTGVEYIVPRSAWTASEPPSILGQELRTAPGMDIWYLHVWVWRENPNGLFADWNPSVACRS